MPSKARGALAILREDGIRTLLNRTTEYVRREASRRYSRLRFSPSVPECRVMDEDWDNLVILDACRYDQFERIADIDGRLEARCSPGSCTPEFLAANFEGGPYHDTVYVTANPMYRKGAFDDVFYDIVDVWDAGWDDENRTVRPEDMATATLEAHESYPEKRIIAHFVQPHYPFIGESGRALETSVGGNLSGVEWIHRLAIDEGTADERTTPWDLLDRGVVAEQVVREAYDENLRLALPHVRSLVDDLPGKTVVTSDHGNLIGERVSPISRRLYGHPPDTYAEELLKVPWLIVDGERRKRIRAEEPVRRRQGTTGVVADRLADLGYVGA